MNGAMIRGKSMRVSFAKYDKYGRPWTDPALQEANNFKEPVWIEDNYRKAIKDVRSYKEVVDGSHQQQ